MIDELPAAPDPASDTPAVFNKKAAALVLAQKAMVPQINSMVANLNSIAAGGAYAIPFMFVDAGSTMAGGAGALGVNNFNTQSTTTTLYVSQVDARGALTKLGFDDIFYVGATSAVKGYIKLTKVGDPSSWLRLRVTSYAWVGQYGQFGVSVAGSSSANPFALGDMVVIDCQRTGDKGDQGPAGTTGYQVLASFAIGAQASLNFNSVFNANYDRYVIALEGVSLSAQAGINLRLLVADAIDSSAKYWASDNQTFTATQVNVSGGTSVAPAKSFNARLEVWNANGVGLKTVRGECSFVNALNSLTNGANQSGYIGPTAVSGFILYPDSGNFTGGTVRVFGIRNT